MVTAASLRQFLLRTPQLLRRRRNVTRALAHLQNRIEDLNARGDFDGGLNLLGAIETLDLRLRATEQDIWIQLEKLFDDSHNGSHT